MGKTVLVVCGLLLAGCTGEVSGNGSSGSDAGGKASGGAPSGGNHSGGSSAMGGGGTATGGSSDASLDGPGDSCAGVTCSGHGTCSVVAGAASCKCDSGYHAFGVDCQADQSCTGVDCGPCGTCAVNAGVAECQCPPGYSANGGKCALDPDPCPTTTCDPNTVCVSEAHCQPLGACVPTCDCSNCGNCGSDNSDGKWNDQQEYCGNLMSSPATMACSVPCPSGQGCIPYNPPICWPMEGCFSL